jgi:hypothetical protein
VLNGQAHFVASSKAFNTEHTTSWQPASTIMSTIPLWPMVAEASVSYSDDGAISSPPAP